MTLAQPRRITTSGTRKRRFGGKTIAPGVYNVFVDLKPNQWTLVLNTQEVQPKFDPTDKIRLSGATNYSSKFDVLRVPMKVGTRADSLDQFTIAFANVTDSAATLNMSWEKTVATVDLRGQMIVAAGGCAPDGDSRVPAALP